MAIKEKVQGFVKRWPSATRWGTVIVSLQIIHIVITLVTN